MRTVKINEKGEWLFNKFVEDSEAVSQLVLNLLKLQKGELLWDLDAGVSWMSFLNQDIEKIEIDRLMRMEIIKINGVRRIVNFESTIEKNKYKVTSLTVETIYEDNISLENTTI